MQTILDKIVTDKRLEVAVLKKEKPLNIVRDEIACLLPVESRFAERIKKQGSINCIAEIKRRSPSNGLLRQSFNPVEIARTYQDLGCAAISVLTETKYFDGNPLYLKQVKKTVTLPLLRKDFIIDEYQIYEAVLLDAEAILLIVHILEQEILANFIKVAAQLGLDSLVEVHSADELHRALDAGAGIIGVNNRNLETFHTDVEYSIQFADIIPGHCLRVSESGIKTYEDIKKIDAAGYDAVLIGEQFMRSPDIPATYHSLFAL